MIKLIFYPVFLISIVCISCSPESTGTGTTEYSYVDTGNYGLNILDPAVYKYGGVDFSLSAKIPENGDLFVKITRISGSLWSVSNSTAKNWAVASLDRASSSQTFTVISADVTADCKMEIPNGTFRVDYYEGDVSSPTRTKEIEVN
ncbi:MAG: hypothetical protein ACPGD5_05930 [Salibacteraceae bacterium]